MFRNVILVTLPTSTFRPHEPAFNLCRVYMAVWRSPHPEMQLHRLLACGGVSVCRHTGVNAHSSVNCAESVQKYKLDSTQTVSWKFPGSVNMKRKHTSQLLFLIRQNVRPKTFFWIRISNLSATGPCLPFRTCQRPEQVQTLNTRTCSQHNEGHMTQAGSPDSISISKLLSTGQLWF